MNKIKKKKKKYIPPQKPSTRFRVDAEIELMAFLLTKMGGMSRNSVKSLLSHRLVAVNGKVTTLYNLVLKTGDTIEILNKRGNVELTHSKLKLIHEDSEILVVEKKEGLLAVSTETGLRETTAFSILKDYVKKADKNNKVYVVHRIDRETSGVMIFAKNKEIQLYLQEYWHQIVKKRKYVAVVEGRVVRAVDTIESWLTENDKSLKVHSSSTDNGGQQAITNYKCLKANDKYSLLELELETGRKNQIRVHMQQIGHPIAGDKKYGAQTNPLGRMALHAQSIEFVHPVTEKLVKFETKIPREFIKVCSFDEKLEKALK